MSGAGFHHSIATRDGLNAAIQASPPHLQVILEATRDGHIRFGHVRQHQGSFLFPSGKPIVLLVGDDYEVARGPQAFSKTSLRRFLQGATSAAIVSGAPSRDGPRRRGGLLFDRHDVACKFPVAEHELMGHVAPPPLEAALHGSDLPGGERVGMTVNAADIEARESGRRLAVMNGAWDGVGSDSDRWWA